jgi:hypothetical protein
MGCARHALPLLGLVIVAGSCSGREPLPAVHEVARPVPSVTPVPLPDLVCIPRMGARPTTATAPKRLHVVSPRFPERETPTRFSGGIWLGVATIGRDGRVVDLRVLRSIKTDPPWPEWERVIPDAVRQSTYEPACVDGHAVEVELTVSVIVDFMPTHLLHPGVGHSRPENPGSARGLTPGRRDPAGRRGVSPPGPAAAAGRGRA